MKRDGAQPCQCHHRHLFIVFELFVELVEMPFLIIDQGLKDLFRGSNGDVQARSNRSRFMTFFHTATKSRRNFSWESPHP